jgi:hypothetical protein
LFSETADRKDLPEAIVEKDFWVCWVLKQVFSIEALSGPFSIFLGGDDDRCLEFCPSANGTRFLPRRSRRSGSDKPALRRRSKIDRAATIALERKGPMAYSQTI